MRKAFLIACSFVFSATVHADSFCGGFRAGYLSVDEYVRVPICPEQSASDGYNSNYQHGYNVGRNAALENLDSGFGERGSDGVLYFKGYRCPTDCAEHQIGYDWARDSGLVSSQQCHGDTQSFVEGCLAYFQ